jgi:glycosyltransferase involved in cell wall biosynthesis
MKKFVLLTNILTPYRIYFYDLLSIYFKEEGVDFNVIVTSKTEPNRNWNYPDFERDYTILSDGKIVQLPNNIFIHLNFNIKKLLEKLQPDIVISAGTYLYPALWTTLYNRRKLKYKVYYWSEAHLYEERNYSKTKIYLREKIRNFIFKKFDGFWFGGKLSLEFINKYSNNSAIKIFVPNLIDNDYFKTSLQFKDNDKIALRKKYGVPDDKIIMICPARLTWVKGQLEFLRSFKDSIHKDKYFILFVGEGDMMSEIIEFSKDISCVQFLGYKNQNEIVELYSISTILLLPSLSDPNPLTCIEALWCGLSILVSSNVGNYPEVVEEGENGFVFDYKNQISLENALYNFSIWDDSKFNNAFKVTFKIANSIYDSQIASKRIVKELIFKSQL